MKCVIKIGYTEILLPDHKNVAKIIETLSQGVLVRRDYTEDNTWQIEEELEVGVKMLNSKAKFKASEELQEKIDEMFAEKGSKKTRPQKALAGRQNNLLLLK
jgi:hypothetical protein